MSYPVPGYGGGMEMQQQHQQAPGYGANQGYAPQGHQDAMGKATGHMPGTAANLTEFLDANGKYKLVMKGAYAAVEVAISPGDECKTEGGAMVTMSNNVNLVAKLEGGIGGAAFRSCCAGEGVFFTHYHLTEGTRGDLLLAPAVPGDIVLLNLDGSNSWSIQKSSYMASDLTVNVGVKTQGLAQGCCSGEGFFILNATGVGRLLVNSYGGIIRYDLQPGEVRKIDNGFLVAWHGDMNYTIAKAGKSLVSSFLSGEGLVTSFTGPGTVYIQTRAIQALAGALRPYLPSGGGGGGGGGFSFD